MKDTTESIFADTYAFIEMIKGNPTYQPYTDLQVITTLPNLIELYYYLLREFNMTTADRYLTGYSEFLTSITVPCIRYGMQFKLTHRKDKLSYVDCIGYARALQLGIPFLTGDSKFKDKPNVEFVR